MGNPGEDNTRKTGQGMALVVAILLGSTVGLAGLLLLTLLTAALLWSGVVATPAAGVLLTAFAGACAFAGGRVAVGKGSAPAMPAGGGVGGLLCLLLLAICWGTAGTAGLQGPFLGVLLALLAGGCLAGLLGKGKRKPKKKKKR